jgi:hypothetical protein
MGRIVMAEFVIQRGLAGHIPAGLLLHRAGHATSGRHGHRSLWPQTTPGRIVALAALAVALTAALATEAAVAFGGLGQGFASIGGPDAAEVNATTGLYFTLNDMDAQVANVLMTGADPGLSRTEAQDIALYGHDREATDADLEAAAIANAGDLATQRSLRAVLDELGQYGTLTADALLTARGPATGTGVPPAASISYYQRATDLMRASILPQVMSLADDSAGRLGGTYQGERDHAARAVAGVVIACVLLLVFLITLQVFLTVRFRRLVNPALVLATLLVTGTTVAAAVQLGGERQDLTVAKSGAFDSVAALTQARAVSYDANADESRYLIDPARAAQYQQSFLAQSQQLANVGAAGIGSYGTVLASDISVFQRDGDVRLGGYLGTELRNITFPGERAAAVRALLAYQAYQQDDRQLRALAATSRTAAIAFDTGTRPGQSDWAFNQYSAALSALTAINTRAFGAAVQAGQADAGPWGGTIPATCAVAACALIILGIRPRLAEYR